MSSWAEPLNKSAQRTLKPSQWLPLGAGKFSIRGTCKILVASEANNILPISYHF